MRCVAAPCGEEIGGTDEEVEVIVLGFIPAAAAGVQPARTGTAAASLSGPDRGVTDVRPYDRLRTRGYLQSSSMLTLAELRAASISASLR